jgi:hypothetical protein
MNFYRGVKMEKNTWFAIAAIVAIAGIVAIVAMAVNTLGNKQMHNSALFVDETGTIVGQAGLAEILDSAGSNAANQALYFLWQKCWENCESKYEVGGGLFNSCIRACSRYSK